jgi:L-galactose dehydrogenase
MRTRTLAGKLVSELGFGGSSLGGVFGPVDERDAIAAVREALDRGINFFDVSPFYGNAEDVLGRALRGVPRDRYVLCTKLGRYGERDFDFSAERVRSSVEDSMARLGVDHLDIVLCHDIEYATREQILDETLPALAALRDRVGAIGVSALPLDVLQYVLDRARLDVVLSYAHFNLIDTTLTSLDRRGADLIAAAPLAMGLLSDAGPPAWHFASPALRATCADAASWCRERGIDLARVALRFALTCEAAATTLVGMNTADEVARNVAALDDPLDPALVAELRAMLVR